MIFVEWHEAISLYTSGCLVYNNIMNFWLAQAVGAVGSILTIISYFVGSKKTFLLFQVVPYIFYALAFLVDGIYVAGINSIIVTVVIVLFYIFEMKNRSIHWLYPVIFSIACILVGVFFMKTYFDIVVIITPILYIFGVWLKDVDNVKLALLLPNATLVAYDIVLGAFTNSITDFVETGVASISAILILIKRAKLKKAAAVLKAKTRYNRAVSVENKFYK